MKKLALALISMAAVSGTALAADMAVRAPAYKAPPPVVVYNWTGFYVGLNAGYGWGDPSKAFLGLPDIPGFGQTIIRW